MYFHVIMPVGADPDREQKERVIRAAAASKGLKPHFPRYASEDLVFNLQSVLQDMKGAQFILVDLSFERPSCYYELGLVEALGKPVHLVAEEGTSIHQTAARRFVSFFRDLKDFEQLVEKIIGEAVIDDSGT